MIELNLRIKASMMQLKFIIR